MKSRWNADPKERTGWLSPGGQFFPCKHGQHQDIADELWRTGQVPEARYGDNVDPLYSRGWLSLHGGGEVRRDEELHLTQPQVDFLGDLADGIRQVEGPQSPWARELDDEIARA